MKKFKIAIVGFGSVGRNIAQLLNNRAAYYAKKYDLILQITGVCKSNSGLINNENGLSLDEIFNTNNYIAGLTNTNFIQQIDANVIIDVGPSDYITGGSSLKYVTEALNKKINVICVSKGSLVLELENLLELACQNQVKILYSGATAAALPTVDFINSNLLGCKILEIQGILTGTTNLILDEMMQNNLSFDEALQKAKALGIAEPDSSFDTQGWDTAAKITIIAKTFFKEEIDFNRLSKQGIEHITHLDIERWRSESLVPRLIGYINGAEDNFSIGVKLELFEKTHPFSLVTGKNKAMRVLTEEMGEFYITGGASSPVATAAAALKDLENLIK
ncbi:homoserine dehydrogenase [Acinetobacter sp. ANC 4636]